MSVYRISGLGKYTRIYWKIWFLIRKYRFNILLSKHFTSGKYKYLESTACSYFILSCTSNFLFYILPDFFLFFSLLLSVYIYMRYSIGKLLTKINTFFWIEFHSWHHLGEKRNILYFPQYRVLSIESLAKEIFLQHKVFIFMNLHPIYTSYFIFLSYIYFFCYLIGYVRSFYSKVILQNY